MTLCSRTQYKGAGGKGKHIVGIVQDVLKHNLPPIGVCSVCERVRACACFCAMLDVLVVDLPPGTGDIQLTLAQKVPVTGAVIVTTPQDIALIDARKGLKMFEKVGIPILGLIENMSTHICPKCGHESHIFGSGGADRMCKDYGTELLGALPLDMAIREQADSGKPTVVSDPDGPVADVYKRIARRVAVKIAESQKDMSSKFPNIVVQNT